MSEEQGASTKVLIPDHTRSLSGIGNLAESLSGVGRLTQTSGGATSQTSQGTAVGQQAGSAGTQDSKK